MATHPWPKTRRPKNEEELRQLRRQMLDNLHRLYTLNGDRPLTRDMLNKLYREGQSEWSAETYKHQFNGIVGAWSEYRRCREQGLYQDTQAKPTPEPSGDPQSPSAHSDPPTPIGWRFIDHPSLFVARPPRLPRPGFEHGDPLRYHSIENEPTNEQGVRLLFGLVAAALGWKITAGREDFPDCEVELRNDKGRWERRSVELEFRSSALKHHMDRLGECDMVVCWEDDWGDQCPVDRLVLKKIIPNLSTPGPP